MLLSIALLPARVIATDSELGLDPYSLGLEQPEAAALDNAIGTAAWHMAERILFEASAVDPESASRHRALGIAHYQSGRHYLAAAALKRADAISPLDLEARFLLASSFLLLDRRHWGRAELERLVELHGNHSSYLLALARVHYDQQRFAAGAEKLHLAIDEGSGSVEAYDLLGQCLEGLGRHNGAAEAFRKAISLDASRRVRSPWPHFHLGSLMHDLGSLELAKTSLEISTGIAPENVPAHVELGIVLRKLDNLQGAARALETAAELAPTDAMIQYSLARVYRQMGFADRSDSATKRFRILSTQRPQE